MVPHKVASIARLGGESNAEFRQNYEDVICVNRHARQHMAESQIRANDVTHLDVVRAFRAVPREDFVPQAHQALAYADAHIDLGNGRHIIRPRDFSKMVMAAEVQPTDVILDIGCGRGYSTAILAQLGETVVGLEDSEEAVNRATDQLVKNDITNAAVVQGDLKAGAAEHGPFDVIFVNGAVASVPKAWTDQLADQGRLVCVVQKGSIGRACVYTRVGETVGESIRFDAGVPLLPGFAAEPEFVF